jgi:hypothetical protein
MALERELRRVTGNHERALNRIKWQERLMKLALLLAVLFCLLGCQPFWSNVVRNWQGPCEDRCRDGHHG